MFKHILVPTDGSEISQGNLKAAIALARDAGASITVLNVQSPYVPPAVADLPVAMVYPPEDYDAAVAQNAREILAAATTLVNDAGVPVDTAYKQSSSVHEAVVKTAEEKGCDLIMMGSHCRKGLSALLFGSEAQKVLNTSRIPVLVHR